MNEVLSVGLQNIRIRFRDELVTRNAALVAAQIKIDAGSADLITLNDIQDIAHKIAGTAGTLGFNELGASAARTDDIVQRLKQRESVDENALRTSVSELIELARNPR